MPEIRIDPISGLRVIIADERADRPGAWPGAAERPRVEPDADPFLEGHEDRTPPELYALRPDGGARDGPGWRVRVFENKFPALTRGGELAKDPLGHGRGEPDLFATGAATGAHEVIVSAPGPVASLADLGEAGLGEAMGVWQERMASHTDSAYNHLIVNEGARAGASLAHSHAQLFALPFVPAAVARERERFTAYFERTQGRNLQADLLQAEVRGGDRLVTVGADAVAICPFASRVPFHVQVMPRAERPRFEDGGPTGAAVLHEVLRRLAAVTGSPPALNVWVRTAPRGSTAFAWRIDVLPRLVHPAGLEMGAGVGLCALAPERAAQALREASPG